MNPRKLTMRVVLLGLLAAAASATAYGCNSDDTNGAGPTPTTDGGGMDGTMMADTGPTPEGGGSDAPELDTGSCVSDSSACNSCYTATQAAQDPLNACGPQGETVNCIPFTTTVPSHPVL